MERVWVEVNVGAKWDRFFFATPALSRSFVLFQTKKTPQAVALNAEAPAPVEPAAEFSSPARKVAIFVGERAEWSLLRKILG